MKPNDIVLENNATVTPRFLRDTGAGDYVRRQQRYKMIDELMQLDDLPFPEAMERIERWDETQHRDLMPEERHLPQELRTAIFRLRVVVSKP